VIRFFGTIPPRCHACRTSEIVRWGLRYNVATRLDGSNIRREGGFDWISLEGTEGDVRQRRTSGFAKKLLFALPCDVRRVAVNWYLRRASHFHGETRPRDRPARQ